MDFMQRMRARAQRRRTGEYLGHALSRGLFATHDYNIANASGAAVRSDLNDALAAAVTQNSGTSWATTFAYQEVVDTSSGIKKRRNAANSGWIALGTIDESFVLSRSSNTILDTSDRGKCIKATGGYTQTLDAAATLGDGWFVDVIVDSGVTLVIDPNSTENIDGATTKSVAGPASGRVWCNGSAFFTVGFDLTLANTAELDNKTLDSAVAKGTWTASGTWTIPAVTLGGTVTGGSQTVNSLGKVGIGAAAHGTYYLNTNASVSGDFVASIRNTSTGAGSDCLSIGLGSAFNNTAALFFNADDGTATRFVVYSNGGIANYQANDVNLSDARVKPVIESLSSVPGLIERLSEALESMEWVRFKYDDQTHDDWNYGYTAQGVREKFSEVVPELVDQWTSLTEVQETQPVIRKAFDVVQRDGRFVLCEVEREVHEPVFDEHPLYAEDGRQVMLEVEPGRAIPATHRVPRMRTRSDPELLAVYAEDLKNIAMAVLSHTLRRVRALEARA
jgi:hypothetical protein